MFLRLCRWAPRTANVCFGCGVTLPASAAREARFFVLLFTTARFDGAVTVFFDDAFATTFFFELPAAFEVFVAVFDDVRFFDEPVLLDRFFDVLFFDAFRVVFADVFDARLPAVVLVLLTPLSGLGIEWRRPPDYHGFRRNGPRKVEEFSTGNGVQTGNRHRTSQFQRPIDAIARIAVLRTGI